MESCRRVFSASRTMPAFGVVALLRASSRASAAAALVCVVLGASLAAGHRRQWRQSGVAEVFAAAESGAGRWRGAQRPPPLRRPPPPPPTEEAPPTTPNQQVARLLYLSNLSWRNCGPTSDPLKLRKLSVSPQELRFPENIRLSVDADLRAEAEQPIRVSVTMKRKVAWWWLTVPCEGVVGSCSFADVCPLIQGYLPAGPGCPEEFTARNLPCRCPFKKDTYSVSNLPLYLPPISLPSWLVNGRYFIKANIWSGRSHFGCISFYARFG